MKNIKFKLVVSISLSVLFLYTACHQKLNSDRDKAQKMVNEAGVLIMNQQPKMRKDALKQAVVLLEKSLKYDSSLEITYSSLLSCYLELGEPKKAIEICTVWLKQRPNEDTINYQRGMIYFRTRNITLANADFAVVNKKYPRLNM